MPDARLPAPLPPGSTIGILGSGQLGRMLAIAGARIGLKTHIYCEERGPAFDVAAHTTRGSFGDKAALAKFASVVDAVTYEFENVPLDTARHLSELVPVRPGAKALEVAQDRLIEKTFIAGLGIPVAPFGQVDGPTDIEAALKDPGTPQIQASASQDPFFMARRAVQVGVDILNGKKPASTVELLPSKLVTRDNIADYKGWTSDRSQ